jgi:putative DNA primase/helicase
MFEPLTNVGSEPALRQSSAPEWRPIMPVPKSVAPPPTKHPKLGEPSKRWTYLDPRGQVLGFVLRFDIKGSGKEIRSLVFAEHERWGRQWRWLGFPRPRRPLYGLDRLAARPEAPVVVCEGEKSADAAAQLLPVYVTVTSPGGSKAAKAADWSALTGRKVTIWRDADEAGEGYAADVVELLAKLSPPVAVSIVTPPEGVDEGWDAADALNQGWISARAVELVAAAKPAAEIEGTAAGGNTRKPAAGLMLDFISEAELWHSPEDISYATVQVDDHRENLEIGSRGFRAWLYCRAFQANGRAPPADAVEATVRLADALALRGPCHPTWRRVAEHSGKIYLDLCDGRWRAVQIDAQGWRIVDHVPPKFLRVRGAEALPEPEAGEAIEGLRGFINVESDNDFRLICAFLAAAIRPRGPYPVLMIGGEQGSSKSTSAKVLRALIDPNVSPIRSAPKEERDLIVSASNGWMLCYDNLSGIPVWLADAFCRLSTGGGFATRANYTDRDEVLFSGQRPIILNGIGELAARPDLAERGLPLFLPTIPNDQRREESEFWAAFETTRPGILGALLDAVSAGLRHLPDTKLDRRPRMADFATFAEACAPGFGWEPGEFLSAYEESSADATATAADSTPLLPAIETLLVRSGLDTAGFDGTAAELLDRLGSVCSESQQRARCIPGQQHNWEPL